MAKRNSSIRLTPDQQALASRNINLARNVAWKYQRSTGIEYSILESAAFEGLCQAAARYDPNMINKSTQRSMKFSSLAVPYIRGSILHYIRDKTYAMRLTHRMREIWVKGRKLMHAGFTDIEISRQLEVELSEWQEARSACSGPPLKLDDHAVPSAALEPDEVDMLTPFRQEAGELLGRMPEHSRRRLERFVEGRSSVPSRLVRQDLDRAARGS